jgi:hypothetical protein
MAKNDRKGRGYKHNNRAEIKAKESLRAFGIDDKNKISLNLNNLTGTTNNLTESEP